MYDICASNKETTFVDVTKERKGGTVPLLKYRFLLMWF